MSEQNKPFVVTDRRRFNAEGESRPDADPSPVREREVVPPAPTADLAAPAAEPSNPAPVSVQTDPEIQEDPSLPPPPTPEQLEQARVAYKATADRLDIAIRSANPGMEHPPAMSFDQLIQSVYMQAIMQLGGGAQEGQQPQVDILGARQSIDMIGVLVDKTKGNLSDAEQRLVDSAAFELQIAFLEVTQALARSAQARQSPQGPASGPGGPRPAGPSIVR